MPKLSAKQIEAFLAVMETGSVTAAARRLHLSQPSVSRMLDRFEREVGFQTFDRRGGRLVPTAESRTFYMEVEHFYRGLAHLDRVAGEIRQNRRGFIRIGVFPAYSNGWIADRMTDFIRSREHVLVSINLMGSAEIIEATSRNEIDIGISAWQSNREGVICKPLSRSEIVCIAPAASELASRSALTVEDLDGQQFVSYSNVERSRAAIDHLFGERGIDRKIVVETSQAATLCHLVARGLGVSLVPRQVAMEYQHLGYAISEFSPQLQLGIFLLLPEHAHSSRLVTEISALLLAEQAADAEQPPTTSAANGAPA